MLLCPKGPIHITNLAIGCSSASLHSHPLYVLRLPVLLPLCSLRPEKTDGDFKILWKQIVIQQRKCQRPINNIVMVVTVLLSEERKADNLSLGVLHCYDQWAFFQCWPFLKKRFGPISQQSTKGNKRSELSVKKPKALGFKPWRLIREKTPERFPNQV